MINKMIDDHIEVFNSAKASINIIETMAKSIRSALDSGNKILIFGNGGSAADAQHFAAELSGRFVKERKALAGLALTTDTSALTAIGNDYGFDLVFERQIRALCKSGDIAFGISTSGNSANVIKALSAAKMLGANIMGLSGRDGGMMRSIIDLNMHFIANSKITARIQELHIFVIHALCALIEEDM